MNARDLIYIPLALITAPLWARKARAGWGERFGKQAALASKVAVKPRLLIHAVSVGEVSTLRGLIPALADDVEVVLSVTTDTGTARAKALFPQTTIVRYPLDLSWGVRRFLNAVKPDAVALVELEVWPNFVGACRKRGVPVCVINGRLSERSFKGYRKIRPLMRRTFAALEFAAVQDEAYARRFEHMGVEAGRCLVTGSMKWDSIQSVGAAASGEGGEGTGARGAEVDPLGEEIAATLGIDRTRPLIVAGSTGPGEEALLDEACRRAFGEGVQLLCAPRKPERFEEAAGAMAGCVRRSVRRDTAKNGGVAAVSAVGAETHPRFLLDTIGELRAAYGLATVVVMGRSFFKQHGSDPIEPIAMGRATVIGPRVGDFESIVRALEGAGGLARATRENVGEVLRELVEDAGKRERLVGEGLACIERERGATERHVGLLRGMVTK